MEILCIFGDGLRWRYDRKGNLIEEGICFLDGGLITRSTYDYDFDERGNWVRMVELTDENPNIYMSVNMNILIN